MNETVETWILLLNVATLVAVLFSLTRQPSTKHSQKQHSLDSHSFIPRDREMLERIDRKLDRVLQHLNSHSHKSDLTTAELQKSLATEVDVILIEVPSESRISVLQAVRELTGFGLREAKNLVESTPQPILRYVSLEDAEKAVQKIANAGGKAQIHY